MNPIKVLRERISKHRKFVAEVNREVRRCNDPVLAQQARIQAANNKVAIEWIKMAIVLIKLSK